MEVKHCKNAHKGSFYIEKDNIILAEMTYSFAGADKMILDHTKVHDSLKVKDAENMLVEAAVNYSRKENISIVPLCPFAKKLIEKTPAYRDVLLK